MVKTIREFETALEKRIGGLVPAENAGFLNDEGIKTLEAYRKLLNIIVFHDNFKEFAEDEETKEIFSKYSDCKALKHVERSLNKRIEK